MDQSITDQVTSPTVGRSLIVAKSGISTASLSSRLARFAPSVSGRTLTTKEIAFQSNLDARTYNVAFTLTAVAAFTNLWALSLSTPRSSSGLPTQTRFPLLLRRAVLIYPSQPSDSQVQSLASLARFSKSSSIPPYTAVSEPSFPFALFYSSSPSSILGSIPLALPSTSPTAEAASSGPLIWSGITLVLLLQVTARTFTLPASNILLNNCSAHPSVLGTLHGLDQSVSAAFRTAGPVIVGWWFGSSLEGGVVVAAWYVVPGVSLAGCASAFWVYEGSGHENWLYGEDENGRALGERLLTEEGDAYGDERELVFRRAFTHLSTKQITDNYKMASSSGKWSATEDKSLILQMLHLSQSGKPINAESVHIDGRTNAAKKHRVSEMKRLAAAEFAKASVAGGQAASQSASYPATPSKATKAAAPRAKAPKAPKAPKTPTPSKGKTYKSPASKKRKVVEESDEESEAFSVADDNDDTEATTEIADDSNDE
ncbi:hypothetical protein F5882DRAFT_523238 [Hyaloscypha sp. PMI_1271]|nr:hypothetical protein F5882DRAFT_523238 [Hyaloscypha sp. PMI_1271]